MPRKKKAAKTTKTTQATRTRKTAVSKKQTPVATLWESLRLGESYTSLVLGIIAVIIGTMLVLSFVHNSQEKGMTPEVTPTIATSQSLAISPTGVVINQPEATAMPTPQTEKPQLQNQGQPQAGKGTYTVATGDNLWVIAEKEYGSGYNWVDIAKANHLANPGDIHTGNKLVIPQVQKDIATVHTADDNMSTSMQTSIMASTYTVMPGDSLWTIAIRAYGDGYQWTKIAQANNLSNPDFIHKGNVLKIPRG